LDSQTNSTEPNQRDPEERTYWLDQPVNVKRLLKWFYISCAAVLLFGLAVGLMGKQGHYPIEEIPTFFSVYGFIGCTIIVLVARAARPLLMRDEEYYDR